MRVSAAGGGSEADANTDADVRGAVLLVDDEPLLLKSLSRLLSGAGFQVQTSADGQEAADRVGDGVFDVVVSDIRMPRMDGVQLLRAIRTHDLDVPVVLMTGSPDVDSARQAVEYGALSYLVKPFGAEQLLQVVARAVRLHRVAVLKRQVLTMHQADGKLLGDRASLDSRFDRALTDLFVVFQPILSWSRQQVVAFEALVRTTEPSFPSPSDLFLAAERLGRIRDVARAIRQRVAVTVDFAPPGTSIYVNLHPLDLLDEQLYAPNSALAPHAKRVVLEITERYALDSIGDLTARIARLRAMGFRVALDDLGAGYAGLSSFALLKPDVVKLDMSLVRGIDAVPTTQKLVLAMVSLFKDLGIEMIAEGVETAAERDTLLRLGSDLLQGFFFARPASPFSSHCTGLA